ncbi:nuclear transport factor 2 family protein [Halobellus sp. GM3]|uniref:nuclear transport factor 2 family protein n=1 Tax=Halobellus sp. GM3 TaxID=3458410 RepID=UPI00403D89B3
MSSSEDLLAIQQLLHEYCFALDEGRADDFVELFTDDGRFVAGSTGVAETDDERKEIVETVADKWDFVAHLSMNPVISVDGDDAEGRWYYIITYQPPDEPLYFGVGQYEATFRRVDDEWKIAELVAGRSATEKLSG